MQRGNLKCNATNCAHNQDYECKAGAIHVSLTTEPCDIKCEAHNCIYNQHKECHSEKIQIDELNACCDSFDYGEHI